MQASHCRRITCQTPRMYAFRTWNMKYETTHASVLMKYQMSKIAHWTIQPRADSTPKWNKRETDKENGFRVFGSCALIRQLHLMTQVYESSIDSHICYLFAFLRDFSIPESAYLPIRTWRTVQCSMLQDFLSKFVLFIHFIAIRDFTIRSAERIRGEWMDMKF